MEQYDNVVGIDNPNRWNWKDSPEADYLVSKNLINDKVYIINPKRKRIFIW